MKTLSPKAKSGTTKLTLWEKIARSVETGRLGWQINVQGKRTLLGVPDGCRQWVEALNEKGYLETVPSGSFRIVKTCPESIMRSLAPLVAARIQAAQRRTNRVVRPEDTAPASDYATRWRRSEVTASRDHVLPGGRAEPKFAPLPRPSNYGKGPTIY